LIDWACAGSGCRRPRLSAGRLRDASSGGVGLSCVACALDEDVLAANRAEKCPGSSGEEATAPKIEVAIGGVGLGVRHSSK